MVEDNPSSDRLDELQHQLYDRTKYWNGVRRSRLSPARATGPISWNQPADSADSNRQKNFSLTSKILIGSGGVFLLTLIVALLVFLGNSSVVSDGDIAIVIQGPTSFKAGDEIPVTISITNKNRTPLEAAELAIIYPPGTKSVNGDVLSRERRPLGLIRSGSTKNVVLKSIIYGPESLEQQIKITLEYRLSGSNALFQKESIFRAIVSSPSVNLATTLPSEATSNQPLEFAVEISANDRQTLKNVLLTIDYPPGFSFQGSQPMPFTGDRTWLLGDLSPGNRRTVTIRGVMEGQDQEIKSFNFTAGEASGRDNESLGARYATLFRTISVNRPFMTTRLLINGDEAEEYVAQAGQRLKIDIDWANNLSAVVENAEFKVYLNGEAFDRLSVKPEQGFYQSADNTILWDKRNNSKLALIQPGDFGRLSFSFNILPVNQAKSGGSQNIALRLEIQGLRVDNEISERAITTIIDRLIKIGARLQLSSRAVYYVGPFENRGPLPPRAGEETTYTVIWSVVNQSNLVRDSVARAVLPVSVRWLGINSPATEDLTYDEIRNEVVWRLGDIKTGQDGVTPAREVAFQIGLTPSLSQIDGTPLLIGETVLTGYDTFAGVEIRRVKEAATTRLSTDPRWSNDQEKVQP